jgi:hypothetical protein
MAFNPTLVSRSGRKLSPLADFTEDFQPKVERIVFRCSLPGSGSQVKATGDLFLSNRRVVFVVKECSSRQDFGSFEMPLKQLRGIRLHQPLLGANYVSFELEPSEDALPPLAGGASQISLTFKAGESGTFLTQLFTKIDATRQEKVGDEVERTGSDDRIAFVDPSDPARVFLAQIESAA